MQNVKTLIQRALSFAAPPQDRSPETLEIVYRPTQLTHIRDINGDGTVNLAVKIYLPLSTVIQTDVDTEAGATHPSSIRHSTAQVQIKAGNHDWTDLTPPCDDHSLWSAELMSVAVGTELHFRYRTGKDRWHPLAPFTDLERIYQTISVPSVSYSWKYNTPPFTHAHVIMETTLEGILAGYQGGAFAPRSREEMVRESIARRILNTDILGRFSELSVDAMMVTITSSVADRSHLNPKFNYLTYDVGDVDWQIGPTHDFMAFLDRCHEYGLRLVPDLPIAHQVDNPFEGSLDHISIATEAGERPIFVDTEAFRFRDYGTWMFKLEDPIIRRQLIEKIAGCIKRFRLEMIRLGFLDGLILQYSNREINYGEIFIYELKAELEKVAPGVVILGETFAMLENPAITKCVDIVYAPFGFSVVEELYKPPSRRSRPQFPEIRELAAELNRVAFFQHRDAVYAQLHDETYNDEHIATGRPQVPWAYGYNPAELAYQQGQELIQMELLQPSDLLDYVRRVVRNAEALTMFTAKLIYMFVAAVDSLALGSLEDSDNWKMGWDGLTRTQLETWQATGLSDRQIYQLHQQHRVDMIRLRQIFRNYTPVWQESLQTPVQPLLYHLDPDNSVLGLFRQNRATPENSLTIVFNLGLRPFRGGPGQDYEVPSPRGYQGSWEVLFDGDWSPPHLRFPGQEATGYIPGQMIETTYGNFTQRDHVLKLALGSLSLLVLRYTSNWS